MDAAINRYESLTAREQEVLKLIGDGYTFPGIAMRLALSAHTIDNHKTRILKKLGLHRTVDLVRFAVGVGLCVIDPTNRLPPVEK